MNKHPTLLAAAMAAFFMAPQAHAGEPGPVTGSWYRIQASAAQGAEIYIYDEIGGWGISAQSFADDLKALGNLTHITVRIHSPGGDVFEGLAIYNLLKQHKAQITVHIDGLAASMGSVIAMAGDTIVMPENALMMIHKPWGIAGGDAEDVRRYADLLDTVESSLLSAYRSKTGLDDDTLKAMLAAETWMTGAQAVAQGFADQLAEPLQAAASLSSQRLKEFKNMPRNTIIKPQGNTSTPPPAPNTTPEPPPAPNGSTVPAPAALTLEAMQARQNRITALFDNFGGARATAMADLRQQCLADVALTEDQVKDKILAFLGQESAPSAGGHIHAGNGNQVGDAVSLALQSRLGQQTDVSAQERNSNPFMGMTLRELARASLAERGIGVAGLTPMQMVGLAFTHSNSDFGNILLDCAHKSLLAGWDDADETYQLWTKRGILTDFKTAHRVGAEAVPSLRKVQPGAEYKQITVGDKGEPITLATYGELFTINRQAIINDDLSILQGIPEAMGRAARATIGDLVYGVLAANGQMSDGKALFSADHNNLGAGPLSIDALDAGRTKMRTQKSDKRNLNIRPAFLLTPAALEAKANQLVRSLSVPGAEANSGIANPLQNFVEVIADARLDDADPAAWYLAAAQGRDTIEVAYLDGIDTPYIDQMQGFEVDGVATKVRIDAAVAALDHRGLYKSTGK